MLNKASVAGGILLASCSLASLATTYPLTVTGLDGQPVTLSHEPKRVVVQDGRDILSLALLDRDNPFSRIVAWNNVLGKSDPGAWETMLKKWPDAQKITNMNFGDEGQVNLEEVIATRPDLLLAQRRAKAALQQSGALARLAQLNIPVLFVDVEQDPVSNTPTSISLLGKVLNREKEAAEYVSFYRQHLHNVQQGIAKETRRPLVFIEAKAGQSGLDSCCFTHGKSGWGRLVETAGGNNIGSQLLPGATGNVAMEKLLAMQPEVYVMTGSQWRNKGSVALPYGYDSTPARVDAAFAPLQQRTGFAQLKATTSQRVYGIYHQFYNHPYNIVAVELLARDFYPQRFKALNPAQTYQQIVSRFTQLPAAGFVAGSASPVK